MKNICQDLIKHVTKIIDWRKKDMINLTDEENESYLNKTIYYICKKEFDSNVKNCGKINEHFHYTGK